MITVFKANEAIAGVLGMQNYKVSEKYRTSKLCLTENVDNEYIIYNNMTKELIVLSRKEYYDSINDINSDIYKKLIQKWFYVPISFDEFKTYNELLATVKIMSAQSGINNYTILPTTDCNARCYYCYEHGCKKINMDTKTAIAVSEYIIKNTNNNQKVNLNWFGGEPLFNIEAIRIIIDNVAKSNLNYVSSMISNAFAFDENLIKEAAEIWKLKKIQITLDGIGSEYNKIKAYTDKSIKNPFERVIENIRCLLKYNIFVEIRLNLSEKNFESLKNVVEYISANFDKSNNIHIYTHTMFIKGDTGDVDKDVLENESKLNKLILESGFANKSIKSPKIKLYHCMADDDGSTMILPDGKIGVCDRYVDSNIIGDIYNGVTNEKLVNEWKEIHFEKGKCTECLLYPSCQRLEKCPNYTGVCEERVRQKKIESLKRYMVKSYKKFVYDNGNEDNTSIGVK